MRIDAEAGVEGGEQAVAVHRSLSRFFGFAAGRADDLAHAQASAGQKDAHRARPVIAARALAGVLIEDLGRATEFTAEDEEDSIIEPSLAEVFDQRRHRLVEIGQLQTIGVEDVRVDRVVVPVAGDTHVGWQAEFGLALHEADTGFDQPTAGQQAAAPVRLPIAPARLVRFLVQVEGGAGSRTGEHREGLLLE